MKTINWAIRSSLFKGIIGQTEVADNAADAEIVEKIRGQFLEQLSVHFPYRDGAVEPDGPRHSLALPGFRPMAGEYRTVTDERAFDLARRILEPQFTTEEAACEIMIYATDAVTQHGIPSGDQATIIEECAKVCDRWIASKNLHEHLAATDIAAAIRELGVVVFSPQKDPGAYQVTLCDDGTWMVHTEGDVIAYAAQGDSEDKARAVCRALNATPPAAVDRAQWQPIETAPKDEIPVLIYVPMNRPARRILSAYHLDGQWWILSGSVVVGKPTLWAPLPTPEPIESVLPDQNG